MICKKCGTDNMPGALFCMKCGEKLVPEEDEENVLR